METILLDKKINLPENIEIFSFIGSRSSPEIRYLCSLIPQETKKTVTILLKWSSFISDNILSFLSTLDGDTNNLELEYSEINEIIRTNKYIRFLIGFNLNDYNNFSIEEMIPLDKILKISTRIFYFCYNENRYFDFCMTERISSNMFYENIWPGFVSFTKILLSFVKKFSLESKLILINNLITLKTTIQKLENLELKSSFSSDISINKLLTMIEMAPFKKSSQYIKDLIKDTKSKFRSEFKKKEKEFHLFYSRGDLPSILKYLIDFFDSRKNYSFEEKSVFKNLFVNGNENSTGKCLLTILLNTMINLLKQKTDLDLIEEALSILKNLSHHLVFKHGVFNNEHFLQLIYLMLESESHILKYEATNLIKLMLFTDYKRYGNLLVDYDKKNCSSIILLLYDIVVEFVLKYTNDCVDETVKSFENKILYETIKLESLELSLKVVEKNNCNDLPIDKIENLFNLCVKNKYLPYKRIKTKLYAILNVLLKYGPISFWSNKNRLLLAINDLNDTLKFLLNNNFTKNDHWQRSSQFLIDILVFIKKNPHFFPNETAFDQDDMDKIKNLIILFKTENVNQLDYESLSIINEYNQEFLIESLIQMFIKDSFNSFVYYARFLYRAQNFFSKKSLILIFKSFFSLFISNSDKIIKLLRLMGELVCMDVIDNELIEPLVNEWFAHGLHKLAISLSLITKDKLDSKLFEKFSGDESVKIHQLAHKHDSLDEFLAEVFDKKNQNLCKKFHNNFINLENDFKIEYEKAAEVTKQEVLEFKIQNESLIKINSNLENEIGLLKSELKRVNVELSEKLAEINDLRQINENLKNSKNIQTEKIKILPEKLELEISPDKIDLSNIDLDLIEDNQVFNQIDLSLDEQKYKQILNTLRHKRKTFKEFRSLIRGSLKHLSINLYTSPFQFLSEIIQNFEDTEYNPVDKPWFIKLIIDKDYLLFCSNQEGFKAKDIKSICSCSESSKQKGKHIGHKGLGFKSVFLCSDNPVIVSNKWKFEFRKEKDEISFITPHYLEEIPRHLDESRDSLSTTFIYLPLRQELKYKYGDDKSEKYFFDIHKNIDPNILLFTSKIKKFLIEDKISEPSGTVIECLDSHDWVANFDYEHTEKILRIDSCDKTVRIFRKKISIPENLIELEELQNEFSQITLAFPETKKHEKIFAFLPICDLKFNFIINADWVLVTNRESINLNSKLNLFYRDKIADFFIQIFNDQIDLRKNILDYIPKNFDFLNDFWKQFVCDLKSGLRNLIYENLNFDLSLKTYVFSEELRLLLNENFLNYYGIRLINPDDTGVDYEYYGFNKISINVILDFLSSRECQILDEEWWINFYRVVNLNFNEHLKVKCLNSNIFLIKNRRTSLIKNNNFYLLIDDAKEIESWRPNLILIDYKSLAERNFLSQKLKIKKVTKDYIKHFIKNVHLESKDLGSTNLIWQDLEFIKQNYANEKLTLFVPTRCGKFRPIHTCYLSRLANYDLSSLTTCSNLIHFREENLDWELFFIKQNCQFPKLDMEENKIDQLFNGFNFYTKNDLVYLNQIFDKIEGYKIKDFLFRLPVKSTYLSDQNFVTLLGKCCVLSEYDGFLPSIDIPVSMYQTAQRMGVTTTLNFAKCVKVLSNLVENEIQDANLYIDWFLKLKSNHDKQSLPDLQLIILDNGKKYKISDIFCCDSSPGLELICKYLQKGVINYEKNSTFKPIESILVAFGAKVKPSLTDCLNCLNKMANDYNLFNNKSMVNCLSSFGFQDIYQMFYTTEMILRSEDELKADAIQNKCVDVSDLCKRESIVALVQSKKSLLEAKYGPLTIPIVTYDNHVNARSDCTLYRLCVCFQNDFLKVLIQKLHQFIFLNQLIFKECPYLFGLINGEYLTKYLAIYLQHSNSNIEETNYFITDIFRQASGIPHIQVTKANYIPLRIQFKNETDSFIAFNNIKFALLKKEWIYISCNDYTGPILASTLTHALKSLLKILNPNRSDSELISESKEFISRISKNGLNRSNWKAWDQSCSQITSYSLDEIVFSEDDLDYSQFSEIFFSSNSNSKDFMKFIKNNFVSDHECYMRKLELKPEKVRINEKISNPLVEKNKFNFENLEVNYEKQKVCSIKAEHFLCCYLKTEYGDLFNEYEHWVSSARNCVYPSNLYSFNDSLGYDFSIVDYKNLFCHSYGSNVESNLCFIEVKGTEHEWDGKFHLTINEISKKEEIRKLNESKRNNQRYVIVVVEWTSNPEKTQIAMRIDWTKNEYIIDLSPESYLAVYVPKKIEFNVTNCQYLDYEYNQQNRYSHKRPYGSFNSGESNQNKKENIKQKNAVNANKRNNTKTQNWRNFDKMP